MRRSGVVAAVGQELFGEGIHAARRLAAADRAEDADAGEERASRDGEPARSIDGRGPALLVDLAQDEEQRGAMGRLGVARQGDALDAGARSQEEDVDERQRERAGEERAGEPQHAAGDANGGVNVRGVRGDEHEHVVCRRKGNAEMAEAPDAGGDDGADEAAMFQENAQHDGASVQERDSCLSSGCCSSHAWNSLSRLKA